MLATGFGNVEQKADRLRMAVADIQLSVVVL